MLRSELAHGANACVTHGCSGGSEDDSQRASFNGDGLVSLTVSFPSAALTLYSKPSGSVVLRSRDGPMSSTQFTRTCPLSGEVTAPAVTHDEVSRVPQSH